MKRRQGETEGHKRNSSSFEVCAFRIHTFFLMKIKLSDVVAYFKVDHTMPCSCYVPKNKTDLEMYLII